MPDIDELRLAFVVAADWCGWSEDDAAEIGAAIREVIEAEDEEALGLWLAWLRDKAGLDYMAQRCRAVEAGIHAQAEALRAAA